MYPSLFLFLFSREREREERDRRRRKLNFFSSFEYRFLYYLLFPPRENNEYTESKEFLCSTSFPYFLSQISSSIAPSFPLSFFRRRRPSERGRKREGGKEKKYSKKREQKERGYFVVTSPLLFSPSFLPNNREGVTAAEGGA